MKTKSAKAKGRKLQDWTRDQLKVNYGFNEHDVRCAIMGEGGEDIKLSERAREIFPYSIECKCTERLSIYKAYDQAIQNAKDFEPLVIFKSNRKKALAIVDAEYFLKLHKGADNERPTD